LGRREPPEEGGSFCFCLFSKLELLLPSVVHILSLRHCSERVDVFSRAGVRTVAACSLYSHMAGDRPPPAHVKPSGVPSWRSFCASIANPRRAAPSRLLRKCRLWRRPGAPGCKSSVRRFCPEATA